MSLQSSGIAIIIGILILSGCTPPKPNDDRVFNRHLDKDFVERNALVDNWAAVDQHFSEVNVDGLNRIDKIYALYWNGAAQYYLGRRLQAKNFWHRAMDMKPTTSMRDQIRQSLSAMGDSYNPNPEFAGRGDWAVQLGLFSTKQAAEKMGQKLTWENLEFQIKESFYNQKTTWIVWLGPYTKEKAKSVQAKMNNKGYSTVLKETQKIL